MEIISAATLLFLVMDPLGVGLNYPSLKFEPKRTNKMKRNLILLVFLSLAWHTTVWAGAETETLTTMLNEFLAGASVDDAAAHDRFWAEDLVYTSSRGLRFGKEEIMEGLSSDSDSGADEPQTVYSAADIRIRQYGDTAVVAFRLLGTLQDDSGKVLEYFNTGTFAKHDGEWQVVAWQATVIPEPES
jgi:ketosteroid isomerase-like protein